MRGASLEHWCHPFSWWGRLGRGAFQTGMKYDRFHHFACIQAPELLVLSSVTVSDQYITVQLLPVNRVSCMCECFLTHCAVHLVFRLMILLLSSNEIAIFLVPPFPYNPHELKAQQDAQLDAEQARPTIWRIDIEFWNSAATGTEVYNIITIYHDSWWSKK